LSDFVQSTAVLSEPQVRANHFLGNAPTEWLTDVIPHNMVRYRTPDPHDDLQYYAHRITWAGPIILGIGKQAKFHPRVFRVFELIEPGLRLENPSYPVAR
jgi:hypothetical protein